MAKAKKIGAKKAKPAPRRGAPANGVGAKPVLSAASALPSASAPPTPGAFKPAAGAVVRRRRKPIADQVASADSVATELTRSKSYVDDFGPKALAAEAFASSLRIAGAWSSETARARNWAAFAENCAGVAWDALLGALEGFKNDFTAAVGHDATILRRYPELTAFVRARGAAARRGAETKKKTKKAAKTAKTAGT